MDLGEILKGFSWKKILLQIWEDVLPKLEEKVLSTESKWDDKALDAAKLLINKFLIEEEEVKSVE